MARRDLILIGVIVTRMILVQGRAEAATVDEASSRCEELASREFSGIDDAPTQVMEAKFSSSST